MLAKTSTRFSEDSISIHISAPSTETELLTTIDVKTFAKTQTEAKGKGSPILTLISKAFAVPFVVKEPGQVRITVIIEEIEYIGGVLNIKQTP